MKIPKASPRCVCPAGSKHPTQCKAKVLLSGTRCAICRRECKEEGR